MYAVPFKMALTRTDRLQFGVIGIVNVDLDNEEILPGTGQINLLQHFTME